MEDGPLTQGIRACREAASHAAVSPPPPSSQLLFTQHDGAEDSLLFRTAFEDPAVPLASEELVVEESQDVSPGDPSTSPRRSPPTRPTHPPPPPPQISSAVTLPPSPPLCSTPIHQRLRPSIQDRLLNLAHSPPSSSSSSPPECVKCGKTDGRKAMIECAQCGGRVHSVSCAGFLTHRAALLQSSSFSCSRCTAPPPLPLPLISTPVVANRLTIQASLDDTIAAVDISDSTPPIASSSPRIVTHSSPDHAHLASRAPPPPVSTSFSFSLDDIMSARIPTLHHCPKTARRELASLKNAIWSDLLLDLNDPIKWLIVAKALHGQRYPMPLC